MAEIGPAQAGMIVRLSFEETSRPLSEITQTIYNFWPDATMELPTDRDLVNVAKTVPVRQWTPDFDCDDFMNQYLCASRTFNRHWCIGKAIFEKTPQIDGAHAMCVAIVEFQGRPTLRVIEPQAVGSGAAAHLLRKPTGGHVLRAVEF